MRTQVALLLAILTLASVQGAYGNGEPEFQQYDAPESLPQWDNAGEPTIGIPWETDSVFYQSAESTYRLRFDDGNGSVTWDDVTNTFASIENVDPMLHGDPVTGRVWAGGLQGPCSFMAYTDDDGQTWEPTHNMCSGAQFDHQSIGSGRWADTPLAEAATYEHAVYYCAQLGYTACTTSLNGGVDWLPPNQVFGACGGLHGHIRVSPVTGTAVVPHKSCAGTPGFGYTSDNGVSWNSRLVPSQAVAGGFDPSAQFTQDSGWRYYGHANQAGAHIGLSKDEGVSWETIGGGMGIEATDWLDVGQFHDPPVVISTFSDVQAGDDDRVAYSFLGVEDADGDGAANEYPSDPFRTCHPPDEDKQQMIWHYYVATSHDAGHTWTVTKASQDPVQVGGIWSGQTAGEEELCRNLLDFNDMDIDSTGRIHIAFADGCVDQCVEDPANARGESPGSEDDAEGFRVDHAALIRQTGGPGLFAAYDTEPLPVEDDMDQDGIPDDEDDDRDGDGIPNEEDSDPDSVEDPSDRGIPAPGLLFAVAVLGAAMVLRRRT